jgi:Family of unknown function (DUF5675)
MTLQRFTLTRVANSGLSSHSQLSTQGGLAIMAQCLERGPANPDHVRILPGLYPITLRHEGTIDAKYRVRFGKFHVGVVQILVPGRQYIEYHIANRYTELEGCVAPGVAMIDPAHADDHQWQTIQSELAYKRTYPILSSAIINNGGAELLVQDKDAAAVAVA